MTTQQILSWAEAHRKRTGKWPTRTAGLLRGARGAARGRTWKQIDADLYKGGRGLPGGTTLARLLYERHGVRTPGNRMPLSESQALGWADRYRKRTGRWPSAGSGDIVGADGFSWRALDGALRVGQRGFPGGTSLAQLLEKYRGVRSQAKLPRLTFTQILEWADVHYYNTGDWPLHHSGHVVSAPEEKWRNIDNALRYGLRGMRGGSSLARLLQQRRDRRNKGALPKLTDARVLKLGEAHYRRTGEWPNCNSGPVEDCDVPGETWRRIDQAMVSGNRGVRPGFSLAKLFLKYGKRRHLHRQPRLTAPKILRWVDAHYKRTGRWPAAKPKTQFEKVVGAPGEKWRNVDNALRYGLRGMPGGSSLWQLIDKHRKGKSPRGALSSLQRRVIAAAERPMRV